MIKTQDRIVKLQRLLEEAHLDAYVVPSEDPHQSEYVAPAWKRREFISGFTGSAGLFACTPREAGLWTDGRYFLQAETELDGSGIKLFRQGEKGVPDWKEWLIQQCQGKTSSRVGVNASLFAIEHYQNLEKQLSKAGIQLVPQDSDLVDRVWAQARPTPRLSPLRKHPSSFAGRETREKLQELREAMKAIGARSCIVSALDEIAWLFNLRGDDVPYNPVFYAFAQVSEKSATLFVHPSKVDPALKKDLAGTLEFVPYDAFLPSLAQLRGVAPVWLDPATSSAAVVQKLEEAGVAVLLQSTPLASWKARKNSEELEGMRAAHRRDGVAMVRFFAWLERALEAGEKLSEISVAEKLEELRALDSSFLGSSFATIAGYGPHGAQPHYRATPSSDVPLAKRGIFLIDSGGQYLDGTTDITRTVALGEPTAEEKRIYTSVLRAHLMLARSRFPRGTNGYQLDAIARQVLWEEQLDYRHGTGHGVGAALCVHEGPFSISLRKNMVPLEVGHCLSNEPGCYPEGSFGVRIENLVTVVAEKSVSAFGEFLGFENLTLCPYDQRLIDLELLSPSEIKQVDAYHAEVGRSLRGFLQGEEDKDNLRFLDRAIAPLLGSR